MKLAANVGVIVVILTCSALAAPVVQPQVVQPWEFSCSEETVKPNLQPKEPLRFLGELKDQSGAAFSDSKIILRKIDAKGKFVEYRTATTEKDGHFDLGTVEPGKYRFLPAPNRGFKQPRGVTCWEGRDCDGKLVLR